MEFYNQELNDFYKDNGIERHRTVRLTPQQNGIGERFNITFFEKVRCLQSDTKHPNFWAEAFQIASYLINKSPSSSTDHNTPDKLWFGKPTSYKHLRVFGCIGYMYMNEGKLHAMTKKCIFLGYLEGVKGYKLWCPVSKPTIMSRDVIFDELATIKDLQETTNNEVTSRESHFPRSDG